MQFDQREVHSLCVLGLVNLCEIIYMVMQYIL